MKPLFYILLSLVLIGCNPLSILGPQDEPEFDKMAGERLALNYWVKTGETEKEERRLEIRNPEEVRKLLSRLNIREVSAKSVGVSPQAILTLSDGVEWDVNIVFEDRIDFGIRKDRYYAYVVETNDYAFYTALKSYCFDDAQEDFPGIQSSSIILRLNLALSAYTTYSKPNKSP